MAALWLSKWDQGFFLEKYASDFRCLVVATLELLLWSTRGTLLNVLEFVAEMIGKIIACVLLTALNWQKCCVRWILNFIYTLCWAWKIQLRLRVFLNNIYFPLKSTQLEKSKLRYNLKNWSQLKNPNPIVNVTLIKLNFQQKANQLTYMRSIDQSINRSSE